MAMDDRKMRILQAIIDDYILTGVPVGTTWAFPPQRSGTR